MQTDGWQTNVINETQSTTAVFGLVGIVVTIVCISLAWWALQSFRFDVFVRNPKGGQARLLQLLAAVFIGHGAARFILDYLQWSMLLKWLV